MLVIVVELVIDCSILVKDPNLGAFATMHNGPNVCEEKDEEGRINNNFDTKAFNQLVCTRCVRYRDRH